MYTNPITPVPFSGLRIDGTISAKNAKKLSGILEKFDKNGLIFDLENNFNTDIVLDNQLDMVTFSHKKYGSLSKYIKPSPVNNILEQLSEVPSKIKSAITRAEKAYLSSEARHELSRRGC